MPSDDRLQELRRQRALVQEHLNWLEHEIVRLTGKAASAPSALPAEKTPSDAEAILEQYSGESRSAASTARRGCLFAFFIALGFFALGVIALYFYAAHRHLAPSP
ncbi:MAG: hypothetical protein KGJ37_06620 [Verrucomicrobiota bacterium]|nr:hypothetical protein [Verrucomicrobiota bacterium]